MSERYQPIGFFDSGVGGTSIWKEAVRLLPFENTLYLADSKNAPYGGKSKEEIIRLSEKNTGFLLERGAKLIVVACNTATTNAISHLRAKYPVPFVGIEPAIKPAALQTRTGKVGILATRGTLSSDLFAETAREYAAGIEVVEQVGEGLVELVEQGEIDSHRTRGLLEHYLTPMMEAGVDHLILGCTHYPYLIPVIKEIAGDSMNIIDSGFAVSRQIKRLLEKHGLKNPSTEPARHTFFTNSHPATLRKLLEDDVPGVEITVIP